MLEVESGQESYRKFWREEALLDDKEAKVVEEKPKVIRVQRIDQEPNAAEACIVCHVCFTHRTDRRIW